MVKGRPGIIYKLLVKVQQLDYYPQLIEKKIIPSNWISYKLVYEYYIERRELLKGKALIDEVINRFYISESSVYDIVKKMEG